MSPEQLDRAAKERLVAEIDPWHHSIDLGDGVITPGGKTVHHHYDELRRLHLPDVTSKSVLDVGAWDGYYTFLAEKSGASRVVALDHYAWSVDYRKALAYQARQLAGGQPIRAFQTVSDVWDPVRLPGKRGFDLAYRALDSRAEVVVDDFMTMDLDAIGTFDVVLLLGVIYHLEEPLRALRRLRHVTRTLAVIESEAVPLAGSLWQFVGATSHDPSIWWVPTAEGLRAMCCAAGYSRADIVSGPPRRFPFRGKRAANYRVVVHAFC